MTEYRTKEPYTLKSVETFTDTLASSRKAYACFTTIWRYYDGIANLPEWLYLKDMAFSLYNTHAKLLGIGMENDRILQADVPVKKEEESEKTYVLVLLYNAVSATVRADYNLKKYQEQQPDLFTLPLFLRLREKLSDFNDRCAAFYHTITRYAEDDGIFDSNE